jgi:hypothetical protein
LAYALLVVGWSMANPPFAAPDEWSHHMRAIGIGHGHLVGERGTWPIPEGASELRVMQTTWANQSLRAVTVPGGTSPAGFDCNAFRPTESAACVDRVRVPPEEHVQLTPVGTYQPLPYFLPGLAIRLAHDPRDANRLARLASALPCIALLCCAMLVVADRGRTPAALAGVLVAITPMVVFLVATLNGSGLETAAGICFAAALARLGRGDDGAASAWTIAGVAGAVLAVSRSTGALWVALLVLTFVAASGLRPFWHALRGRPRRAAAALVAIAAGVVLNRLWERAYGPVVQVGFGEWPGSAGAALAMLLEVGRQEIGVFGTLDSPLPRPAYVVWLGLLVVLTLLALARGTWRERLVLLAALFGLGLAGPVLLHAAILVHTGFMIQGRHVLPVVTAIPLLAGEILARFDLRSGGGRRATYVAIVAAFVASLQLGGWYWNARRQAVGVAGPMLFLSHAEWSPPLGWWVWLVVVVAACVLLAASAVVAARVVPDTEAR